MMNEDKEIFIAYTGKSQDRQSIGVHSMPPDQIRRAAVALYVDARQRQEAADRVATAEVWIGTKWLDPSVAEVDAHRNRVEALLAHEREMRAAHVDEPDDEDEPPAREEREEVCEVELTEDDFAAAARDDEPSDEPEEPPLVDLIGLDTGFDSGSDLEI